MKRIILIIITGLLLIACTEETSENDVLTEIENTQNISENIKEDEKQETASSKEEDTKTVVQDKPKKKNLMYESYEFRITSETEDGLDYMINVPHLIDLDAENLIVFELVKPQYGDDYYHLTPEERKDMMTTSWLSSKKSGLIGVTVFITEDDQHGNAAQLDDVFHESNSFYNDIPNKLIQIIDDSIKEIEALGIMVNDQVLIEGFSSTAIFAHKFAILYPERTLAIIAGSTGNFNLMIDRLGAGEYNWPNGMVDFEEITGHAFNKEAFDKVLKFIYIGNLDNSATFFYDEPGKGISKMTQSYLNLGTYDPERIYNYIEELRSDGFENYYFRMFNNVSHYRAMDFVEKVAEDIKVHQEMTDLSVYESTDDEIKIMIEEGRDSLVYMYMTKDYYDKRLESQLQIVYDMKLEIDIVDINLKSAVCEILGKSVRSKLRYEDIYGITSLRASGRDIEDISGLSYFNNLQILDLSSNKIKDFNELEKLVNMKCLYIQSNSGKENINVISNMDQLIRLNVDSLVLDHLDFLEPLNHLTSLSIDQIMLKEVTVLSKYKDMVELNVMDKYLDNDDFYDALPFIDRD